MGVVLSRDNLLTDDLKTAVCVLQCGCQTVLDSFVFGIPSFVLPNSYSNLWSTSTLTINKDYLNDLFANPLSSAIGSKAISKVRSSVFKYILLSSDDSQYSIFHDTVHRLFIRRRPLPYVINFIRLGPIVLLKTLFFICKYYFKQLTYSSIPGSAKLTNEEINSYLTKSFHLSSVTDNNTFKS